MNQWEASKIDYDKPRKIIDSLAFNIKIAEIFYKYRPKKSPKIRCDCILNYLYSIANRIIITKDATKSRFMLPSPSLSPVISRQDFN